MSFNDVLRKVPLVCVLISLHLKTQIVKSIRKKSTFEECFFFSNFEGNVISNIPINNSDYYCILSIMALYFQNVFLNSLLCNFVSNFLVLQWSLLVIV